jgi:hypothetical protein
MSMNCDIILKWSATPEQLAAVGSALWRWCNRTAGAAGIYRYLDNQALADLIAGKLPDSSQTAWRADTREMWRGSVRGAVWRNVNWREKWRTALKC